MTRLPITLVAVFGAGYLGFLAYSYVTRNEVATVAADANSEHSAPNTPPPASTSSTSDETPTVTAPRAPDSVEDLIAAASGEDAEKRAAAIVALGSAPKAQALPVLERVLNSGGIAERQLALSSLRTLALQRGDADGAVSNVLRQTIYHSDDENLSRAAQAALSDVEQATAQLSPNTAH